MIRGLVGPAPIWNQWEFHLGSLCSTIREKKMRQMEKPLLGEELQYLAAASLLLVVCYHWGATLGPLPFYRLYFPLFGFRFFLPFLIASSSPSFIAPLFWLAPSRQHKFAPEHIWNDPPNRRHLLADSQLFQIRRKRISFLLHSFFSFLKTLLKWMNAIRPMQFLYA